MFTTVTHAQFEKNSLKTNRKISISVNIFFVYFAARNPSLGIKPSVVFTRDNLKWRYYHYALIHSFKVSFSVVFSFELSIKREPYAVELG